MLNMTNIKKILLVFIIATITTSSLLSNSVFAGPFREKFREKIKERRSSRLKDKLTDTNDSALDPSLLPSGVNVISNIPYGSNNLQNFDVYYPSDVQDAPVIFMVHGGGWRRGDKTMSHVVINKVSRWVPKGFIFVSTNYRMIPDLDPIGQAKDVVMALTKAQKKIKSWGGDKNKFILMGHSAGAHLVSLIATDLSLSRGKVKSPWIGTIALDSAAYNVEAIMMERHFSLYDKAFGDYNNEYWRDASPFYAITPDTGSILAVYSTKRKDAILQTKHFAKKAASLDVQVVPLGKDMGHGEINNLLGKDKVFTQEVEAFMAKLHNDIKKLLFGGTSGTPPEMKDKRKRHG